MKSSFTLFLPLLAAVLIASSFLPLAYALGASATTSPSGMGPDQINTLTVTDPPFSFKIDSLSVTGPDGTVYTYTQCGPLTCIVGAGGSFTAEFGTGDTDWQVTTVGNGCDGYTPVLGGPGNTHCSGQYNYTVGGISDDLLHPGFNVDPNFTVPEFAMPVAAVVAVALLLINLRSRRLGNLQYQN